MATGPGKLQGGDRREDEGEGVHQPGEDMVVQVVQVVQVGQVTAPAMCPGHTAPGPVSGVLIRHCSEHVYVSPHLTLTAACDFEVGAPVSPISK